jgi:hypothetical protein
MVQPASVNRADHDQPTRRREPGVGRRQRRALTVVTRTSLRSSGAAFRAVLVRTFLMPDTPMRCHMSPLMDLRDRFG